MTLQERLRDAGERVVAHCMKPEKPALMSIPVDVDRDVDVLLYEAATALDAKDKVIKELVGALEAMMEGTDFSGHGDIYRMPTKAAFYGARAALAHARGGSDGAQ